MSFALSSSIASQYLKAGVRLAACFYLVGAFITLAIWITAFVVVIAMLIVIFVIGGPLIREVMRGLGLDNGGSSRGMSTAFRAAASFARGRGESREREGLLGKYTESTDAQGNVVAESREREGLLGKYTETTDAQGNVVAESREREGLLGKYTEYKKP